MTRAPGDVTPVSGSRGSAAGGTRDETLVSGSRGSAAGGTRDETLVSGSRGSAEGGTRDVRNDRTNAVTRFCLALEEHRRTEAGRVRTARELLDFFFPRTQQGDAEDRIFLHIPPEVRGPIISAWGVRGAKSAVRDSDDKVRQVVADALAAGDVDDSSFEDGIDGQTLIDWVPLTEWWNFWRTGKLTGMAIQKALAVGRELGLFDDRWFLLNVEGRGGKLKGTDTLCDTLSKDQIAAWIRKVHESGDGSPAGLVSALGWETVLAKTSQEALLFALDAFAKKVGLVAAQSSITEKPVQGDATDLPANDGNVAVPDIPALDSPKIDEILEVSAAPVQSGATPNAPPVAFRENEIDTATYDKPKPPPSARKAP